MKWFWAIILFSSLNSFGQNRFDVVIDEIMADPTPQVALPSNEWMELRNTSSASINLQNWRIGDASGLSGPMPAYILQPDSMVIICTSSAVSSMNVFGPSISVTNFPSLDNAGDLLFLRAANGKTIHAINYTDKWYQSELKKEGGWTLEMIDTKDPCGGVGNWKASTNNIGGTPGKKNSIDGINSDTNPPQLINAFAVDSVTIMLVYNEPVDSLSGSFLNNYSIDGGIIINSATSISPLFDRVQLKLSGPLHVNIINNLSAINIKDCKGNTMNSVNKIRVGLPADPIPGEWIINEILFNPRPGAYDYVEFYNNSDKIIDVSNVLIASRNASGIVYNLRTLSNDPLYVFPREYIVETEDADNLARNYLVLNNSHVATVLAPPSFPDDEGCVIALNGMGIITDEVKYKDDWHFKLIDNAEGISLERIDPSAPAQDAGNWHSAASTAGFGTPGYKNSQYRPIDNSNITIAISPKIFSPDNDGHDDVAVLQYNLDEPGYIANSTIFDAAGRVVRYFVKNALLGLKGYWTWDGLDEKTARLPVGTYIIFTEIFNLQGKKQRFKNVVVLARKY